MASRVSTVLSGPRGPRAVLGLGDRRGLLAMTALVTGAQAAAEELGLFPVSRDIWDR
jgi:hypothetical protein